jgi:hypothetical protein
MLLKIEEYAAMKCTRLLMSIALLGAVLALSACKQNDPNSPPAPLLSIAG